MTEDMSEKQENGMQNQSVQNEKKKNPGLRLVIFLLELIILIAGIAASAIMMKHYNDPKRVADQYFSALKEGDYATAYSYLQPQEAGESDFVNVNVYAAVMEKYGFADEAADAVERTDAQLGEGVYVLDAGRGAHTVQVLETGKKRLFFFKEYEVCPLDFYAEDVYITAPKMMTVSVNGITLNENNSTRDDASTEVYLNAYETAYRIDRMIAGDYRIQVSGDVFQTYTEDVTVNTYYNVFMMETPMIKEGTMEQIAEELPEVVKSLFQSALNGEDAQTAFAAAGLSAPTENGKSYYDDLVDDLLSDDGYFTSFKLSDFEASNTYSGWFDWETGDYCCNIALNYVTSYSYDVLDWWTESYYESKEDNDYGFIDFDMVYRNGEWMIDDLYISSGIYIW